MYKCEQCGCTAPPNIPAQRVVIESRRRAYPAHKAWGLKNGKPYLHKIPETYGYEIVREKTVCASCAERLRRQLPLPDS